MADEEHDLARGGFLELLTAEERSSLDDKGRRKTFHRGASLFNEGDRSERVVFLLRGRAKISYFTEDGKETLLAIREPGDMLGELAALDGGAHSATAVALEAVEALIVKSDEFAAFLQEHPRVSMQLLRMLSTKLRDADEKRIDIATSDTVRRIARRLVELAHRFAEESGGELKISLSLSQEELAGWAGCSREAASKALQILRRRGLIETRRRRIIVLDLEGLERRTL